MEQIKLSLAEDYVSHWTVNDALRELFQNSYDREIENKESISSFSIKDLDKKHLMLTIANAESVLSRKNLLLGNTTKHNNKNTIGQFGEGFKLALLVLTRLGKPVVVKTGKYTWTPVLEFVSLFGCKVLTINIEESQDTLDRTVEFCVKLTKKEFTEYKKYNLKLQTNVDKYKSDSCEVLYDRRNRGKVFVGGLFVCKSTAIALYGYNFDPSVFPLGRDRKAIDGFNLAWETSKALVSVAENDAERSKEILADRKKNKSSYESNFLSSFASSNSVLVNAVWNNFEKEYPGCIPVESHFELKRRIKKYKSFKGVILPENDLSLLKKAQSYKERLKSLEEREPALDPSSFLNNFLDKHKSKMSNEFTTIFIEELMLEAMNWNTTT